MIPTLRVFAVVFAVSISGMAQAALPPGSYNKLRIEAEEAVVIQVTSVKEVSNGGLRDVMAEATVFGVERSKSGLKKGDRITIKYAIPTTDISGPVPVPLLEKDTVYPAFLRKMAIGYAPSAYGWSFKMTPEA